MDQERYSTSPTGEKFPLPADHEYAAEFDRLKNIVEEKRNEGKEIVVVMGLGFVGIVMAAVVADASAKNGNPNKFVIGMQRPSTRSYWKLPYLNRGISPIKAEDPEVEAMIKRCVNDKNTLSASYV